MGHTRILNLIKGRGGGPARAERFWIFMSSRSVKTRYFVRPVLGLPQILFKPISDSQFLLVVDLQRCNLEMMFSQL